METHDQIQWKKDLLKLLQYHGMGQYTGRVELNDFFLQTLQHLHDEIKEKKVAHHVRWEDLQAIFTRYGVNEKHDN